MALGMERVMKGKISPRLHLILSNPQERKQIIKLLLTGQNGNVGKYFLRIGVVEPGDGL